VIFIAKDIEINFKQNGSANQFGWWQAAATKISSL